MSQQSYASDSTAERKDAAPRAPDGHHEPTPSGCQASGASKNRRLGGRPEEGTSGQAGDARQAAQAARAGGEARPHATDAPPAARPVLAR